MTQLQPSPSGPSVVEPVLLPPRSSKEILGELKRELSKSDLRETYPALEDIFYNPKLRYDEEYKLNIIIIAEAFASPLYSDNCKRYWAASHVSSSVVLQFGDMFLTEEIILGHIERRELKIITLDYVKAVMSSSHLSERIIEATLKEVSEIQRGSVLKLTPDIMVTPRVIKSWISTVPHGGRYGAAVLAARAAVSRIRKAHPEYEGFPDEWALKVFCGE